MMTRWDARRLIAVALALAILAAATGTLSALAQGNTPTPRPTRTPLPSLTPSLTAPGGLPTGQPAAATPTPAVPQATPTSPLLAPTQTLAIDPMPTEPLVRPAEGPPLAFRLPAGWRYAFQTVPIRTAFEAVDMRVAIYQGPVQNGIGNIIILWGFPGIAPPPTPVPLPGTPTAAPGGIPGDLVAQMLWTDGLRLLQGTVVDITCNVGTAGQRVFSLGEIEGIGTYFNINQCQGEPDTAGWFVGVSQHGRNYLFYAFIEPIEAYNDARAELQAILDTVVFEPPATPAP